MRGYSPSMAAAARDFGRLAALRVAELRRRKLREARADWRDPVHDAAVFLDRTLVRLVHSGARSRLALGELAAVFRKRKAFLDLGFSRLGDWARERLGISGSEVETAARVAVRLRELPGLRGALVSGGLSWTKARLLASVVTVETEGRWLEAARRLTVRELEREIAEASERKSREERAGAESDEGDGTGDGEAVETGSDSSDGDRVEAGTDVGGRTLRVKNPVVAAAEVASRREDDDEETDGEPRVRFRLRVPGWVWVLFRRTVDLARQVEGSGTLPVWKAVDAISAEAFSSAPSDPFSEEIGEELSLETLVRASAWRSSGRRREPARGYILSEAPTGAEDDDDPPLDVVARELRVEEDELRDLSPPDLEPLLRPGSFEGDSAFRLDRRMRELVEGMERVEWQTGRALRLLIENRLAQELGWPDLETYVRERLGVSLRKVRSLVALDRAAGDHPALGEAYRSGRLSWVRAMALLPLLRPHLHRGQSGTSRDERLGAWVERARRVMVRSLVDQVDWALEQQALRGDQGLPEPPPLGERLEWPEPADVAAAAVQMRVAEVPDGAGVQMRVGFDAAAEAPVVDTGEAATVTPIGTEVRMRAAADPEGDAAALSRVPATYTIEFWGPASVVANLRRLLLAFSDPDEPSWMGLVRLLLHVSMEWHRQGKKCSGWKILVRDGYRCTAPGCTSRRSLEVHHLIFRSNNGTDDLFNLTLVCSTHHHEVIHRGKARARGRAPDGITWELGTRPGHPPLMRLVGDVYVEAGEELARAAAR